MSISKSTQYGNIEISIDAIASLAGGVVTECYGVVGMASVFELWLPPPPPPPPPPLEDDE